MQTLSSCAQKVTHNSIAISLDCGSERPCKHGVRGGVEIPGGQKVEYVLHILNCSQFKIGFFLFIYFTVLLRDTQNNGERSSTRSRKKFHVKYRPHIDTGRTRVSVQAISILCNTFGPSITLHCFDVGN